MRWNLFGPQRRVTRSHLWSVRPNGSAFQWQFKHGHWWWDHGCGSFPQSAAFENAQERGYNVVRLPVGQRPGPEHIPSKENCK